MRASVKKNRFDQSYWQEIARKTQPLLKGKKLSNLLVNMFWVRYLSKRRKKGKLLDVGCGRGYFLESTKHGLWWTYGIDISKYNALRSKGIAASSEIMIGDVENLPFREQLL